MSAIYNFGEIVQGQTLEERIFALKRYKKDELITLANCIVTFRLVSRNGNRVYATKDNSTIGGVKVLEPNNCVVQVDEIQIDLNPRKYIAVVDVEYPDGDKKIFTVGEFTIKKFKDFIDV